MCVCIYILHAYTLHALTYYSFYYYRLSAYMVGLFGEADPLPTSSLTSTAAEGKQCLLLYMCITYYMYYMYSVYCIHYMYCVYYIDFVNALYSTIISDML